MDGKISDRQKKIDELAERLKKETHFENYNDEDYIYLAKVMLRNIEDVKNNFNFIKAYDKNFWESRNNKK